MDDLRGRFGRIVAVHRRRRGMTQEALAGEAGLSLDMITKIEAGGTGVSFQSIDRLAAALQVDPAELFTITSSASASSSETYRSLMLRLAELPEGELQWLSKVIEAMLEPKLPSLESRNSGKGPAPRARRAR